MKKTNVVVLNPLISGGKNIVRDVLYGCWCAGKRIGGATVPPFSLKQVATCLEKDDQQVRFIDAQALQLNIAEV
ncbi:MAG: hypothetical protein HQK51_21285, partial [Oligoflexia bacterium]|nr:hypothetical protein [Oligoflexia bacterium]